VQNAPLDAPVHVDLCRAHLSNQDVPGAVTALRAALRLVGTGTDAGGLGSSLRETLDELYRTPPIPGSDPADVAALDDALDRLFRDAVREYASGPLLEALSGLLARCGRKEPSIQVCESALAARPGTLGPYACMVRTYLACEDPKGAVSVLTLAGTIDWPDVGDRTRLALLWADAASKDSAARERAIKELRAVLADPTTKSDRDALEAKVRDLCGDPVKPDARKDPGDKAEP
jgi:hypothetical protein